MWWLGKHAQSGLAQRQDAFEFGMVDGIVQFSGKLGRVGNLRVTEFLTQVYMKPFIFRNVDVRLMNGRIIKGIGSGK